MDQNQSLARHMSKSVLSNIKILVALCLVFAGIAAPSVSAATLVPGQITITSIIPSSGQLVIAWELTAPGGALTDVEFTTDNGTTWLTTGSATSPATITTTSRSATVGLQDGNYSHLEDLDNDAAIDDTIVGYAVSIRAVNASGQGAPSKRFEVIVGSSRTQPASITAVTSGDRSLTLTLQHPVRATGVGCVQYSTNGGTTWSPLEAYSTTLTVVGLSTDQTTPLVNGTRYSVKVRYWDICGGNVGTAITALPGFGISGASATAYGTPSDAPAPSEIISITPRTTSLVVNAELGLTGGSPVTRLEYSTDGGTTWAPILPIPAALSGKLDTPGSPYSFTLSAKSSGGALDIDTSYSVTLRSLNIVGYSVASTAVTASTGGVPRPSEIVVIDSRATSLVVYAELGMSNGSTISRLEYSTDGGTTWAPILPMPAALSGKLDTPGTEYSFAISTRSVGGSLSIDTSYTVALRSRNSAGNSVASASVTTSTAGSPRPSEIVSIAPRSNSLAVSAELGMAGGSVITRLDYTTDGGTTWAAILPIPAALSGKLDTPGSAYSFTITLKSSGGSLSPDTNYTVALRSANSAGNSSASASMVAETTGVGYLAPPSIDTVTVRNKSFVVKALLPTLPTGVSTNRVEYSTDSGTTWRNSGQKTGSFIISLTSGGAVLTVGALYSIEVRLVTTAGNGLASETYQISAGNVSTPPVLYTASSNSGLITVSGTLGNTNGASITRLEYSTDNGVSWSTGMTLADVTTTPSAPAPTTTTTVASSSSTSTTAAPTTTTTVAASSSGGIPKNWTFVVSNISSSLGTPVQPGAVYLIKVRSVSAAGISGPSNAKAVTLAGSPRIPTILSATAANNSITLTISYAKTGGVTVTDVEYSTDDGASWKSSGDTANSLVITEESAAASSFLSPGELYIVRIRLIANGGVSGTSAPRSVRTTGTDSALTMEKLADKPLSLGSFDVKGAAKSKSGRTIVYASSTLATCSVTTTKVTLLKTGICTIVASIVADGEFKKDSVSKSFNITEVKEATLAVGEDITVNALAALQLPSKAPKAIVKATVVPASKNICTIKGSTISIVKAGVCKVKLVSKNKAGKAVSKVATITVKQ